VAGWRKIVVRARIGRIPWLLSVACHISYGLCEARDRISAVNETFANSGPCALITSMEEKRGPFHCPYVSNVYPYGHSLSFSL
jgi:hypothetical protein